MDRSMMRLALALAEQGAGHVSPNPMVGAVIVKDGRIIGQGYHMQYGGPHAEVNAVQSAQEDITGATVYVTLEPCSHHGKTPPCADMLIEKKVGRVVIGSDDPNPLVAGRGIRKLRDAGIEVVTGVLKEDCDRLNRVFFHYITEKRPFVVMKTAMTLDGKIADSTGYSRWITGEAARMDVQDLRKRLTGIMVGIGTVLTDDPQLTCRVDESCSPVRIIADSALRTPPGARVLDDQDTNQTIIACLAGADPQRKKALEEKGALVLVCREKDGRIDLEDLMQKLGERKIDSILLEGGSTLNDAALRAGIVQQVITYIAPKIVGGREAKTPVGGQGFPLSQAALLDDVTIELIGDDYRLSGMIRKPEGGDNGCSRES